MLNKLLKYELKSIYKFLIIFYIAIGVMMKKRAMRTRQSALLLKTATVK